MEQHSILLRESLRDFLKSALPFSDYEILPIQSDGIIPVIEDYILPSLIYLYYKEQGRNFIDFLGSISFDEIESGSPEISTLIRGVLSNYKEDSKQLFGKQPVTILGDPHDGHRTKYKKKNTIVYGRSPEYESFICRILKLLPDKFTSFFPDTSHQDNMTERKFIPTNLTADGPSHVEDYYENLGFAIPLLLLLRGIDNFAGNMTVSLPYPIFFDMECIFVSDLNIGSQYSLAWSGLIKRSSDWDISTISGGTTPLHSYLKPILTGSLQKPVIIWKTPIKRPFSNIPVLNEQKVKPQQYAEKIIDGYDMSTKILIKTLDNITQVVDKYPPDTRVVLRTTRRYKSMLQQYCFPHVYTRNPIPQKYFKEEIEKLDLKIKGRENVALPGHEADILSKGLIPIFKSNIKELEITTGNGRHIATFKRSQFDVWQEFVSEFDSFILQERASLEESLDAL